MSAEDCQKNKGLKPSSEEEMTDPKTDNRRYNFRPRKRMLYNEYDMMVSCIHGKKKGMKSSKSPVSADDKLLNNPACKSVWFAWMQSTSSKPACGEDEDQENIVSEQQDEEYRPSCFLFGIDAKHGAELLSQKQGIGSQNEDSLKSTSDLNEKEINLQEKGSNHMGKTLTETRTNKEKSASGIGDGYQTDTKSLQQEGNKESLQCDNADERRSELEIIGHDSSFDSAEECNKSGHNVSHRKTSKFTSKYPLNSNYFSRRNVREKICRNYRNEQMIKLGKVLPVKKNKNKSLLLKERTLGGQKGDLPDAHGSKEWGSPIVTQEPREWGGPIVKRESQEWGCPIVTQEPKEWGSPIVTQEPKEWGSPIVTQKPKELGGPVVTQEPKKWGGPIVTQEPKELGSPIVTQEPKEWGSPIVTQEPKEWGGPIVTQEPKEWDSPIVTQEPKELGGPIVTQEPKEWDSPIVTQEPKELGGPIVTQEPKEWDGPIVTQEPKEWGGPIVTQEPKGCGSAIVTQEPKELGGPIVTQEPKEWDGPIVTHEPKEWGGPIVTQEPKGCGSPIVTQEQKEWGGPIVTQEPKEWGGPIVTQEPKEWGSPIVIQEPKEWGGPIVTQEPKEWGSPIVTFVNTKVSSSLQQMSIKSLEVLDQTSSSKALKDHSKRICSKFYNQSLVNDGDKTEKEHGINERRFELNNLQGCQKSNKNYYKKPSLLRKTVCSCCGMVFCRYTDLEAHKLIVHNQSSVKRLHYGYPQKESCMNYRLSCQGSTPHHVKGFSSSEYEYLKDIEGKNTVISNVKNSNGTGSYINEFTYTEGSGMLSQTGLTSSQSLLHDQTSVPKTLKKQSKESFANLHKESSFYLDHDFGKIEHEPNEESFVLNSFKKEQNKTSLCFNKPSLFSKIVCNFCGMVFRRTSDLERHELIVHNHSPVKRFKYGNPQKRACFDNFFVKENASHSSSDFSSASKYQHQHTLKEEQFENFSWKRKCGCETRRRFDDDDELTAAVDGWLGDHDVVFYQSGINAWQTRWNKCVELEGNYVEK